MHNKDSFSKLGLSDIDISATYASFTFYLPTSRVTVIQTSLVKRPVTSRRLEKTSVSKSKISNKLHVETKRKSQQVRK